MNVLSVFDGISAGRLALERACIKVDKYYRSEIDKYANQVAIHHYPSDIQLGDITKWREWNIDWSSIDLFIGGSPCQGFSFAGKQAGTKACLDGKEILVTDRETYLELKSKGAEFLSQSHLFWEYVLILDHIKKHNPNVKFLLENVKMRKELLRMISDSLGVEDIVINSNLVSAQNRHRHYWCNWKVEQLEDKEIYLNHIIDDHVNSYCGAFRGRYLANGETRQQLEIREDNKTNCLTTVYKDNVVIFNLNDNKRFKGINEDERGYRPHMGDTKSTGISELGRILKSSFGKVKTNTLTATHQAKIALNNDVNNLYYRKLTPMECARLQTFPDGWCESVISDAQAYKAYGNSWTVDVIAHIFSSLN